MKKNLLGFTLIELLIVIALLGALAVALLAALDPLEQIRKGTDTGVRNTAAEIHGGATRYSALKGGVLPFLDVADGGSTGNQGWMQASSAEGRAFIQKIIDSGELKSDFLQLADTQLDRIFITGVNGTENYLINVCYAPTAKSFRLDPNSRFHQVASGTVSDPTPNECPNKDGTTSVVGQACYWCVR